MLRYCVPFVVISKIDIFCSVFTAILVAPSTYSYSAHLCGKSHRLFSLCVAAERELSLSGGWKLLPRWHSGAPKTRGGDPQHCQVRRELGKTKGNIYLVLLLHPSSERLFKDWIRGLVCFQTALVLASVLLFSWFLDHKTI